MWINICLEKNYKLLSNEITESSMEDNKIPFKRLTIFSEIFNMFEIYSLAFKA